MSTVIEASLPAESLDPATGEVRQRFEPASAERVAAAVRAARDAQRSWAKIPIRRRAAVVGRIRHEVHDRRESLAGVLEHEIGKPAFEALFEVMLVADTAAWVQKNAPRLLCARRTASHTLTWLRKSIEVRWEPYGVVGIIAPWNYPLMIISGTLLPALAAGNAVVLKPSELAPGSAEALLDALRAAGVPDDLVQCVQGPGEVGQHLLNSGIDRLFFTGSEATGRKVAAVCGEHLIPCSLELGGSDPAIVLEDADPAHAAAGIVWGRCSNAGQTCVAAKRVFVLAPIHDRFVAELSRAVSSLRVGCGPDRDVGPLIRPQQTRRLTEQRDDALRRGARLVASAEPEAPSDFAVPAQVLLDVHDGMRVMREETFGPLLPVVRVESVEEAIARANATAFGLSASVWTADRRRGLDVARRLDVGTVMINDVLVEAAMLEVAHGGVKSSGAGWLHGEPGMREVARQKTIVIDRFSAWRQLWWFPYSRRMHDGVAAFFTMAHGRGFLSRTRAGLRSIRLMYFGG